MDYDKIEKNLNSLLVDFSNNDKVAAILEEKLDMTKSDYDHGKGYYQHKPNNVLKYKTILVKLAAEITKHPIFTNYKPEEIHPMSIAGKVIDECGNTFLITKWGKLCRVDEDDKEWGQSFYALNPGKGEDINLTNIINPIFRKQKIKKILEDGE